MQYNKHRTIHKIIKTVFCFVHHESVFAHEYGHPSRAAVRGAQLVLVAVRRHTSTAGHAWYVATATADVRQATLCIQSTA